MDTIPDVMTMREAAAYLRVHPRTLADWAREGAVPASKLARAWRFRKVALDQWLASKERPGQSTLPGA